MLKNGVKDLLTLILFALVLALAVFLPISPVYFVAGAGVLGVILSYLKPVRKEGGKK